MAESSPERQTPEDSSNAFKAGIWKRIGSCQVHPDLREAHDNIKILALGSKSKNTIKSYNSNYKQFCTWCNKFGFCALPASDYHTALYLSTLRGTLRSDSKINSLVYGISFAHKFANLPDPCYSNLVKNVKDGLLKSVTKQHNEKDPISSRDVELIVKSYGESYSLVDKRFVAMALLSFSGFLRFDEVVSLKRSDISIKEGHVELNIVRSKTDQQAKGSVVTISKTHKDTCPVKALQVYLLAANIEENSVDHVFRRISFFKKSGTFKLREGPHLSYTRAREIFLQNISSLGLDKNKFGLHSLRSGGATSASDNGISDRLIKKHGRWKTDLAKDRYIREKLEAKKSNDYLSLSTSD